MRTILFTLLSLACSLAIAATVYKWIDENGVVHYSDQPHANAQKVQVQAVQTYKSSPVDSSAGSQAPPPPAANQAGEYLGCAVAQPSDGASYANVDSLNVLVRTDPALHPGDQIFVLMDGAPVNEGAATGNQFTITPVERGTHTLQAVIRDASGNLLCQSPGVTVEIHQNSTLNQANPQNRKVTPH